MAGKSRKKTTIETSSLKSYDDVNATLLDMAKIQATLEKRLAKFNEEEALRRKVLQEFTNPLIAQIEEYHREIYLYCAENKKDFEKKPDDVPGEWRSWFSHGHSKNNNSEKVYLEESS
jgi:hypothetical protein